MWPQECSRCSCGCPLGTRWTGYVHTPTQVEGPSRPSPPTWWPVDCRLARSTTMTNRTSSREHGVLPLERPAMTAARDRLAIAELTTMLAGDFDLPTVLETIAHDARTGFDASSAAVVLRDDAHRTGEAGIQVVAEALPRTTDADLRLLTAGPVLESARDGAVTMIPDLADTEDTRWPDYRRDALRAGMRGMRAFPLTVLGLPVGGLV